VLYACNFLGVSTCNATMPDRFSRNSGVLVAPHPGGGSKSHYFYQYGGHLPSALRSAPVHCDSGYPEPQTLKGDAVFRTSSNPQARRDADHNDWRDDGLTVGFQGARRDTPAGERSHWQDSRRIEGRSASHSARFTGILKTAASSGIFASIFSMVISIARRPFTICLTLNGIRTPSTGL
jgi:hypothetical protein